MNKKALKEILRLHKLWLNDTILALSPLVDTEGKHADLPRADLTRADLTRANLTGANLTRANLTGANLTGAKLTGAKLKDKNELVF